MLEKFRDFLANDNDRARPTFTRTTIGTVVFALMLSLLLFVGCGDSQNSALDKIQSPADAFGAGTYYGTQGEYENAIRAYTKAIALDPQFRKAYTYRALTHLQLGSFDDALNDLNKAVEIDPSADSYRTRGDVYAGNGNVDMAINDYDKTLQLDPSSASTFRNRAIAYSNKRDYQQAIDDLSKAIELQPKEPHWRYDRAVFKAQTGDYQAAMQDATQALELMGGAPSLQPGEQKNLSELQINCVRLIADLEKAITGNTP